MSMAVSSSSFHWRNSIASGFESDFSDIRYTSKHSDTYKIGSSFILRKKVIRAFQKDLQARIKESYLQGSKGTKDTMRRLILALPLVGLGFSLANKFFIPPSMAIGTIAEYCSGKSPGIIILQGLPFTARVCRPIDEFLKPEEEKEEVLVVKIRVPFAELCGFNVFIDLPDASGDTEITCPQFAGSFYHEPRRVKRPDQTYQDVLFRIGVGEIIKDLELNENPSILVTFVPTGANQDILISIQDVTIIAE